MATVSNRSSDAVIEALARAAGLELLWAHYREEILAAAKLAAEQRAAMQDPDPVADPWPPMQVPGASPERDG